LIASNGIPVLASINPAPVIASPENIWTKQSQKEYSIIPPLAKGGARGDLKSKITLKYHFL
jgi:hypothetical protein